MPKNKGLLLVYGKPSYIHVSTLLQHNFDHWFLYIATYYCIIVLLACMYAAGQTRESSVVNVCVVMCPALQEKVGRTGRRGRMNVLK